MGHNPDRSTGCTCDTPTGSENRRCDYCRQEWSSSNTETVEAYKARGGKITKIKKGPHKTKLRFSSGHFGPRKSKKGNTGRTSTRTHRKMGV